MGQKNRKHGTHEVFQGLLKPTKMQRKGPKIGEKIRKIQIH